MKNLINKIHDLYLANGALETLRIVSVAVLRKFRLKLFCQTPAVKYYDYSNYDINKCTLKPASNDGKLAIVVHSYYKEILIEILSYIQDIQIDFKLYVTVPFEQESDVNDLLAGYDLEFLLVPMENIGRDVLPFLKIMPRVLEDGFSIVLKLHTKRSIHRNDGDAWRQDIFNKLIAPDEAKKLFQLIKTTPEIGMIGAEGHILSIEKYIGANQTKLSNMADEFGLSMSDVKLMPFVASTMFYAKVAALVPLLDIGIDNSCFEEEAAQVDGTMSHAIERALSVSVLAAGFKIVSSDYKKGENILLLNDKYNFAD